MRKDRILRPDEAAKLIGVSKATIYQWSVAQRKGESRGCKVYRAGDGKLYLRKSEVLRYAAMYRPENIQLPELEDPANPWLDDDEVPASVDTSKKEGAE